MKNKLFLSLAVLLFTFIPFVGTHAGTITGITDEWELVYQNDTSGNAIVNPYTGQPYILSDLAAAISSGKEVRIAITTSTWDAAVVSFPAGITNLLSNGLIIYRTSYVGMFGSGDLDITAYDTVYRSNGTYTYNRYNASRTQLIVNSAGNAAIKWFVR
jgi:hypothetical protein